MGEAERRTRGVRGAQPPASYLDTGAHHAKRPRKRVAERIRTPHGGFHTGRDGRRMERQQAARVLRGLRQARQVNPHAPAAVERRQSAARVLAAGLQLRMADLRAAAVLSCGKCRALWEPDLGAWVGGAAGLIVASVDECGHRLCPQCAPRASRRNRRRILRRLEKLRQRLAEAEAHVLARSASLALDTADQAADFLSHAFAHVPPDHDPWHSKWPTCSTPTAYVDEHGAIVLADATPLPADHVVRELHEAESDRVNRERAGTLFRWRFAASRDRVDIEAHRAQLSSDWASRSYPKRAARDVERAREQLARAIDQEDADDALKDAEHPRRARAMAAACEAADAARMAADAAPYGPPLLHGRELARYQAQAAHVRHADAFAARAQRAMDAATAQGWSRLRYAHEATCLRHAVDEAKHARRLWRDRECARKVARRKAARARLWRDADVRFLTLTTKARPDETAAQGFTRIAGAISRLTRTARWRSHVAGAIVRIEVERSSPATRRRVAQNLIERADAFDAAGLIDLAARTLDEHQAMVERERKRPGRAAWWHPHVHIAASCGYWEQHDLQALWRRACKEDSAHADIRSPSRGVRGVLDELTKYVTKPTGIAQLTPHEAADLCEALAHRSTLRCTGALRGLKIEEERAPTETTDGAQGDGHTKPIGYVADPDSIFGTRGVFLAASSDDPGRRLGVWRDDAAAQEAVRHAKETAWDLAQARRIRARTDDLPPT